MSFLLSGIFSLFFEDEISEQGDSFLFCEIRGVEIFTSDEVLGLDFDDEDSEEDENVEKFPIFTSEFFSLNHC